MKHVIVEPGVCGLTADVRAEAEAGGQLKLTVDTKCKAIEQMVADLGDDLSAYAFLGLTGEQPLLETARVNYKIHAACPTLAGITKCVEAEAGMALPRDASIRFIAD